MGFADIPYLILVCLFSLGYLFGSLYVILLTARHQQTDLKSRRLQISRWVFVSSGVISWILLLVLFVTLPKLYWPVVILNPLLLLIFAYLFWQLCKKLNKKPASAAEEDRIVHLFAMSTMVLVFLIFLQFLFRYSGWIS